jgi:hypothetical protein
MGILPVYGRYIPMSRLCELAVVDTSREECISHAGVRRVGWEMKGREELRKSKEPLCSYLPIFYQLTHLGATPVTPRKEKPLMPHTIAASAVCSGIKEKGAGEGVRWLTE